MKLENDVDSLSPVVIKVDLTLVQKVDLIQNVLIKLYLIWQDVVEALSQIPREQMDEVGFVALRVLRQGVFVSSYLVNYQLLHVF